MTDAINFERRPPLDDPEPLSDVDREKLLDDMHHALGRPLNAMAATHRNFFCAPVVSAAHHRFAASNWMDFGRYINEGRDAIWHVNGAGKEALANWLTCKAKGVPAND